MVLSFLCPTNSWAFQRERRPQEAKSWRYRWCQRMKFRFLDHGLNYTKMISSGLEKHMLAAPGTICLSKNELFWLKGPEKGVCDLDTVWRFFPSRLSRIKTNCFNSAISKTREQRLRAFYTKQSMCRSKRNRNWVMCSLTVETQQVRPVRNYEIKISRAVNRIVLENNR